MIGNYHGNCLKILTFLIGEQRRFELLQAKMSHFLQQNKIIRAAIKIYCPDFDLILTIGINPNCFQSDKFRY
jgi:hypothetical protein